MIAEKPRPLRPTDIAKALDVEVYTVVRWITAGVLTPSGRVFLAAHKVGGRWRIDPADWEAFDAAVNARPQRTSRRSESRVRTAQLAADAAVHKQAKRNLVAAGLLERAG